MSDKTKSLMDLYNEKYVSVEDGERVYTEAQVKERAIGFAKFCNKFNYIEDGRSWEMYNDYGSDE